MGQIGMQLMDRVLIVAPKIIAKILVVVLKSKMMILKNLKKNVKK
jgi:hypothetical protein